MNKAYGLRESAKELEPTENLDVLKNELFASRRVSKLCQDNHRGRLVRCMIAIKYSIWNTETKKVLNGIGKKHGTNLAEHNLN